MIESERRSAFCGRGEQEENVHGEGRKSLFFFFRFSLLERLSISLLFPMFTKLAALALGQAPAFPYTVGEALRGGEWTGWKLHAGVARDDSSSAVSVWRISGRPGDARLELARHGVRKLKMVSWWPSEDCGKQGREEKREREREERRFGG